MVKTKHFERLVIAAYRLPFKFTRQKNSYKAVQNSGGLVSAMLALSENFRINSTSSFQKKILWTGIADNIPQELPLDKIENEHFDILPVQLTPELNDNYYGGFCNDLIWPLFHYFPSYCVFNNAYFSAYQEANAKFCDEIIKAIQPGDFIWIHDYQLLMLPGMIRKKRPDVHIGFFLHIPFPSFEIFRLLPRKWREAIIQGMLGADLVGFHTHDYSQHFIKCVKRTTGYECHQNIIYTPDKLVKSDAFPIGIDFNKFNEACTEKSVIHEKQKIKDHLKDLKLIFSVDRLDYTKGLLLRLKGFEAFLEQYPYWQGHVIFNMVVVPSRDHIEKYKDMKKEIEFTVGRINGKFSTLAWRPIIYQYKSLSFQELVALYDMSDVGLITPLRDGMNLVAKEFVACQVERKGVLILSEMAGAAAELNEAILINPSDDLETAEAIVNALEMKPAEKRFRILRMQDRISRYNVFTWASDFFEQAFDIQMQQTQMSVHFINKSLQHQLSLEYQNTQNRLFLLDYDGTLVSFAKFPDQAIIEKDTLEIIKMLARDPQNEIVIISGRDKKFLDEQFQNTAVTLVAEHGLFTKRKYGCWESLMNPDGPWKESLLPLFKTYVNRCHGTFIEEKSGSIAWHFRNADSGLALLRLNELKDDLAEIIRHKTDFEILEGNKVLEVKCGRYNKGQAALNLIENNRFDFILAAGDDKTDEFLFKVLPDTAFSIRIGISPTYAKYNIPDNAILLKLLHSFSKNNDFNTSPKKQHPLIHTTKVPSS